MFNQASKSMHEFAEQFINALPTHIENLKIPGRLMNGHLRTAPIMAQVEQRTEIQNAMREVLYDSITQDAQSCAERTFKLFLKKDKVDEGVLRFFNGWNETHKTTSLVSAKIIMRLSVDVLSIPIEKQREYGVAIAHMHEVAKDDFGLGHEGHDGMYSHMTAAFGASGWMDSRYAVRECNAFSDFLYQAGVAEHKSAINSVEHKQSMMGAIMVSIASELWNGREYNFMAQHIEEKLLSINWSLRSDVKSLRDAKGYVMGHSGEVENRHGLHALAAAQAFGRTVDLTFEIDQLKDVMLAYNKRVGRAFNALHRILTQ